MSEAPSRIAGGRPVPHIVTELPGPKARAHVAFDASCHDDPMAATWWKDHRDALAYRGHRFAPP